MADEQPNDAPEPRKIKAKGRRRKKAVRKQNSSGPRPYPKVLLSKALEIAQKIKELNGGNPWTPTQIAEAIGMGPKGPDFYYVTAASRDFSLTIGTRDTNTIALAELGREIVYAPTLEAEKVKKVEAFNKIELFSKVLQHYKGSNLPEMKYLGNTLEREFNLAPKFHEEFSRVFRANCEYLGIASGTAIPAQENGGTPNTVVLGEPAKRSSITAFVIMPFVEKSEDRPKGFFAEVLRSLITPAAIEAGFKVETANRQGSDVIQSTIVNELLEADLVIAD